MPQFDGQNDFSGGMVDRFAPEKLGPTQYASGKNIEIRDGYPTTRRGSVRLYGWTEEREAQAFGIYEAPFKDQRPETLLLLRDEALYRGTVPQPLVEMGLPSGVTLSSDESGFFLQGYQYIYLLRGEDRQVLRWDGYTFNDWETISAPAAGDTMPNSAYGIYAYNRLWLVTNGDTVNASDLLSEAFNLTTQSWQVDSRSGGDVTVMVPYLDGQIVILKENSVHIWSGCNPGTTLDPVRTVIDSDHGCIARNSAVAVGSDVWFLSADGIRSVVLTNQNKTQLQDVTISHNIPGLINRINWRDAGGAVARVFDNYFLLFVPFDTSTVNDTILVYDLTLKTWVGYWQGWEGAFVEISALDNQRRLYVVNQNGDVDWSLKGYGLDARPSGAGYLLLNAGTRVEGPAGDDVSYPVSAGDLKLTFRLNSDLSPSLQTFENLGRFRNTSGRHSLYVSVVDGQIQVSYLNPTNKWVMLGDSVGLLNDDSFHTLIVRHDGVTPSLLVDGVAESVTYPVSVDLTLWFADMGDLDVISFNNSEHGAQVFYDQALLLDDSGELHMNFSFAEGAGTSTSDAQTGAELAFFDSVSSYGDNSPEWYVEGASVGIETKLLTRAYTHNSSGLEKRYLAGEIHVSHRDPQFELVGQPAGAFEEHVLLPSTGLEELLLQEDGFVLLQEDGDTLLENVLVEYSPVEYDIFNKAKWGGDAATFNDPYRQNYAPFHLGSIEISVTDEEQEDLQFEDERVMLENYALTLGTDSIRLDAEQEHTEQFFSGANAPWMQLELTNRRGTIAVKNLVLQAVELGFGHKSED